MNKAVSMVLAAAGLGGGVLLTGIASNAGWGVPQPRDKPVSIKEGSAHGYHSGHHRSHYFVGGGPRHGK